MASGLAPMVFVAAASLAAAPLVPKNRPYDVQHYRIELRLQADGTFQSDAEIKLVPDTAASSIELDAFQLDVTAVTDDTGAPLAFVRKDMPELRTGTLVVKARSTFLAKQPLLLKVKYSGRATHEVSEGLFWVQSSERRGGLPYFFTHLEPTYARRVFPCNDEPYDKATTEIIATVDSHYQVLSNGRKVSEEEITEGERKLRRVHWLQDKPHSTYLVALAIGDFEEVPVPAQVPASLYILPGKKSMAEWARTVVSASLKIEQDFVGVPYPWARFSVVTVPRYLWSGMENTSLVMSREARTLADANNAISERPSQAVNLSHELSHQWFGDLVTSYWWNDAWLSEGFATYMSWVALDELFSNDLMNVERMRRIAGYLRDENGPRSHPLSTALPTAEEAFNQINYVKGACVLWMLEHWLGRAAFREGLKSYLEKYAYKSATSRDFFAEMLKVAGPQKAALAGFQDAWLSRTGYPVIRPSSRWNGKELELTLTQRPNQAKEKGLFVFKLPIVLHRETVPAYHQEVVALVDKGTVQLKVSLPGPPEWIDWNRDGTALARIDEAALTDEAWAAGALKDPDPVWRLISQFALMRGLLTPSGGAPAKKPSAVALKALEKAIASDPSPSVRFAVLDRLQSIPTVRLPGELAPAVIVSAQPAPKGTDPLGEVLLRRAALETLGRFDNEEGAKLLLATLDNRECPLDLLSSAAIGVARLGDERALRALREALAHHRTRGYPYFKAVGIGFGSIESNGGYALLRGVLTEAGGDNELARLVNDRLRDNTTKGSAEFSRFVSDFVLTNPMFGDDMKGRMLKLLDEVRTPQARQALTEIAKKANSQRLRVLAEQALAVNFGAGTRAN